MAMENLHRRREKIKTLLKIRQKRIAVFMHVFNTLYHKVSTVQYIILLCQFFAEIYTPQYLLYGFWTVDKKYGFLLQKFIYLYVPLRKNSATFYCSYASPLTSPLFRNTWIEPIYYTHNQTSGRSWVLKLTEPHPWNIWWHCTPDVQICQYTVYRKWEIPILYLWCFRSGFCNKIRKQGLLIFIYLF